MGSIEAVKTKKWNKLKCLDCGHIFDIRKGMVKFCNTWFFYCEKCESTNVEYYEEKPKFETVANKGQNATRPWGG